MQHGKEATTGGAVIRAWGSMQDFINHEDDERSAQKYPAETGR